MKAARKRMQARYSKGSTTLLISMGVAAVITILLIAYLGYIRPAQELKESVKAIPEVEEFLSQHPDADLSGKTAVTEDSLTPYGAEVVEQPIWKVEVSDGERNVTVFLGGDTNPIYVVETWRCGNGECEDKENCEVCEADCGCSEIERCEERICTTYCGNAICEDNEGCETCREDCATPQDHGICKDNEAYWVDSCGYEGELRESCTGETECFEGECRLKCGNGICEEDEDCGTCKPDCGCESFERCQAGVCITFCGNEICELEENCGTCEQDCGCGEFGRCTDGKCEVWCGNDRCDSSEDCESCSEDCGCSYTQRCENAVCVNFCGNGICEEDEKCDTCTADCGCSSSEKCENEVCVTWCGNGVCDSGEGCESCTADCACSEDGRCISDACIEPTGSKTDTISVGETRTYSVTSNSYEVTLTYVNTGVAKFVVNGVSTSQLTAGESDVLSDGNEIKLIQVIYQGYAGGTQSAEFIITTYN